MPSWSPVVPIVNLPDLPPFVTSTPLNPPFILDPYIDPPPISPPIIVDVLPPGTEAQKSPWLILVVTAAVVLVLSEKEKKSKGKKQ